jgi:hypothetical protein
MTRRDPRTRDRLLCTRIADRIEAAAASVGGPSNLAMKLIADAVREGWKK